MLQENPGSQNGNPGFIILHMPLMLQPISLSRYAATACGLLALASMATGQNVAVTDDEVKTQARQILDKAFTNCENADYFGAPGRYFFGLMSAPVLACSMGNVFQNGTPPPQAKQCQIVIEYKDATFLWDKTLSPADLLNGMQWNGFIKMNYAASRGRHLADGDWSLWGDWLDKPNSSSYLFRFWKKKGVWSEEVGPDLVKLPISIGRLVREKPPCNVLIPPNERLKNLLDKSKAGMVADAPGRSINIRDAIGSTAFEVCYSIKQVVIDAGHTRRICDKTGEVIRVPGDLAVPPAFWETYAQSCKAAGMGELEVTLTSPSPDDGRKRFISCTSAFILGANRKQLIERGLR
jgi:hypothetical protein